MLTKITKRTTPPLPETQALKRIAEIELEISVSLKAVSRKVGLTPEKVLAIMGRWLSYELGTTPAEFLGDALAFDWYFWGRVSILAREAKRNGRAEDGDT